MYPHVFDQRIIHVDLLRLKTFFPEPDAFQQMRTNLESATERVCHDPSAGKDLRGRLDGWRSLAWASSSTPNWDPWPDMRLVYRFRDGVVRIFAVGKRAPGDVNDVYSIAAERAKFPE
ncbi:hypothetical protein [Limnochorda pilosa]|uniref:Type II toxin-antitoxin system RelE/ParE family toxin n=1 Tax=Limnochorda pilosa TaxID=1555112 RepID=A0A0K2SMG9_LIMPI|nr:hypothetical protein [Limnochorda pilosa]BAS28192.1 hypothetical protein LIP_2351 [Limnochorda pilosa]